MNQEVVEPEQDLNNDSQVEESQDSGAEEKMVPLRVMTKERKRRQEAEQEVKLYREQQQKASETDDRRYESATKEDLDRSNAQTKREIREEDWAEKYPERSQMINAELKEFLETRPNYADAIANSKNRYKEAWLLMNALSPKEQKKVSEKTKSQAPGSPAGIPKSTALSETVDLMAMNDEEFNAWRKQKRGRR
jgi:hypothetical protein